MHHKCFSMIHSFVTMKLQQTLQSESNISHIIPHPSHHHDTDTFLELGTRHHHQTLTNNQYYTTRDDDDDACDLLVSYIMLQCCSVSLLFPGILYSLEIFRVKRIFRCEIEMNVSVIIRAYCLQSYSLAHVSSVWSST